MLPAAELVLQLGGAADRDVRVTLTRSPAAMQ
jgi:hypothetical protein